MRHMPDTAPRKVDSDTAIRRDHGANQAPIWAITEEKIETAIRQIARVARPRKIILFGSVVRGTANTDSDLDILVVTSEDVRSCREESVRIRRALRGTSMPMDILVISEARLHELGDRAGLVYREALRHGRVVYEAAR